MRKKYRFGAFFLFITLAEVFAWKTFPYIVRQSEDVEVDPGLSSAYSVSAGLNASSQDIAPDSEAIKAPPLLITASDAEIALAEAWTDNFLDFLEIRELVKDNYSFHKVDYLLMADIRAGRIDTFSLPLPDREPIVISVDKTIPVIGGDDASWTLKGLVPGDPNSLYVATLLSDRAFRAELGLHGEGTYRTHRTLTEDLVITYLLTHSLPPD